MAGIGVKNPGFAPEIAESGSAITYGPGVSMGRAVQVNIQWQAEDGMLYGDDAVAETDNGITGVSVDVTTTEMTQEAEVAVLGVEKDGDDYWDTGDPGPVGGFGYIRVLKRFGNLLFRVDFFPKMSFRRNNEDIQTKGQTITWGTPSVHGVGTAVFNNSTGKASFRKKRYFTAWADAYAYLLAQLNITGATQGLTLSNTAVTVAKNATVTLTPTSAPAGATAANINWSSDNEAAATVAAGVVTGVAAGEAVITAEYKGLVARARVTVTAT